MGCCSCFELFRRAQKDSESAATSYMPSFIKRLSHEHLLGYKGDDNDGTSLKHSKHHKSIVPINCSKSSHVVEDITEVRSAINHETLPNSLRSLTIPGLSNTANGDLTRKSPVKLTVRAVRSEDFTGNKMVNEYVRDSLLGTGIYGKVVLHHSKLDGKFYAIKILRKSRLRKVRVAPLQTALTDVYREVDIMKELEHPHIVNLIEVIDDPDCDHFYMVLEYLEGGSLFEGSGPPGGIGEAKACHYIRDVMEGLLYLHRKNVIHGDIKPENLLISSNRQIKIGDFSVSHKFQDNNDIIQRSPGTPVFTAPECCTGSPYHGKTADIWALGVTLYCMLFGCLPFTGDTLQDIYDKILNKPLYIPNGTTPILIDLLEGLLCKDPDMRMSLEAAIRHPWLAEGVGHDTL